MASLGLIVLTLPLFALAALLALPARRLRAVPPGVSLLLFTAILGTGLLALLALGDAVQSLVLYPARLQERYLGAVQAGPLRLRGYSEFGFQDPGREWTYALAPETLQRLRARCRPDPRLQDYCRLGGYSDDDGGTDLRLNRGRLEIIDYAM